MPFFGFYFCFVCRSIRTLDWSLLGPIRVPKAPIYCNSLNHFLARCFSPIYRFGNFPIPRDMLFGILKRNLRREKEETMLIEGTGDNVTHWQ